ncbi:MAG: peptide chain release factor 2 [Alphaproteobacteria bacterium]|nr:peptide chain release factor 2 [Alphaproteobacteria bacterium]MDP6812977.1 peptide chain release factor 2 [Alphaproteobacteria bacterium]
MRAETQAMIDEIDQILTLLRRHLDWDVAVKRLDGLNRLIEDPDLWNDSDRAQRLMRERTRLDGAIGGLRQLEQDVADAAELIELGEAEGDDAIVAEAEGQLAELRRTAEVRQLESMLSGEADGNNCYVEIHAGAGGTESQDWAEMLLRMYGRWSDRRDFKTDLVEASAGEEAGLKSATMHVRGEDAYGWLKTESGVHRLVRISPFDAANRRHTSFASVWVFPEIDDDIEIEINDGDLRVDTYRASGAGGQHVNRTDSAVRITHEPSGIVVQCQQERSQHKNRATAMKMLKARLYEDELRKREAEKAVIESQKTDIGWGHQIRSYVLHPYQMVKDLRTGVERGDAQRVLDGDLDGFMEASLAARVGGGASAEAAED